MPTQNFSSVLAWLGGACLSENVATIIVEIILSYINRRILRKRIIFSYEEVRVLHIYVSLSCYGIYMCRLFHTCAGYFIHVQAISYMCRPFHTSVDQKWIAPSPKFSIFFFLHSYVLWDETRLFLPQLALCCDCVRCY